MDWRDVLYPVYSRDQIEEYAFTLCIRSDGSLYGTADGNKCRQGSVLELSILEKRVTSLVIMTTTQIGRWWFTSVMTPKMPRIWAKSPF